MGRNEDNRLGLIGATCYIVGSVVGSGVFIAPKGILEHAGSIGLSLLIWGICAVCSMLSGINYVELGTSIPESGAELAYISYVGWRPVAFSFVYLSAVIHGSCSGAILFLTFGQYIVEAVQPLVCMSPATQDLVSRLFGFGILALLTVCNMYSLRKTAGRIQVASTFSKMITIAWIVGIGAYFMIFRGYTSHFKPGYAFKNSNWSPSQIVMAIYQGLWAFSGYTTLNYGTEDVQIKDFKKTLPRAVLGGLMIASFVYITANIAYFSVLTPQQVLDSDAVATLFVKETLGTDASYVMPALVGLLLIGTLNSDVFIWSRFMSAGARKGFTPTAFALIHPENDSPRFSVLVNSIIWVAFSFIGNIEALVDYLTIVSVMCTCFALLALIIIKWKRIPVAKDAVKYHIFWPILNLLINIALLLIPFTQNLIQSLVGFGLFILGCAAYYVFIWPKNKPQFLHKIDDAVTKACQVLLWSVVDKGPEYQKEGEKKPLEERTTERF